MLPALKVLVVDGDPVLRELVTAMLLKAGHFPSGASTALEGLKKFDDGNFDLVLSHYGMAGMKGDELAATIKNRPKPRPVILVTTSGPPEPSKHVDAILTKPFTAANLHAAIKDVMARLSGRKEAARQSSPGA